MEDIGGFIAIYILIGVVGLWFLYKQISNSSCFTRSKSREHIVVDPTTPVTIVNPMVTNIRVQSHV
jgi:hypothetical protein